MMVMLLSINPGIYRRLCDRYAISPRFVSEEILFHRCQSLLQQQDLIQGLTGFHWWIKIGT
ncbi:MAG: hypothetical protein DSM106950_35870 [Stigonema ocellatum SAG 48.90 = DSM 106950]|nr:hypothetical protein [Stigonema ocellatum SAG 48.90 = DSM 106950]